MRRLNLRFAVLLLALILVGCGGSPQLAVVPAQIDLGTIAADAPVTTVLQVHNQGTRPLTLTGVTSSCGCTTATLADTNVAAGAMTELTVAFDPTTHPGLYGPVLRLVYLTSNDPAHPEVEIPVTVEILPPKES